MQVTTIGLDIAKNVFQVHGIDAAEKVVVRRQLRRRQVLEFFKALPPCLVGMEACATAHYWARELTKLGHQVRLMPAKDVKAYVKRNKNDAADAEAICEAVRRPTMRFVQIKSTEQQGRLMLHRARDLLMRQRTQVINAMRAELERSRNGRSLFAPHSGGRSLRGIAIRAHKRRSILAHELIAGKPFKVVAARLTRASRISLRCWTIALACPRALHERPLRDRCQVAHQRGNSSQRLRHAARKIENRSRAQY